MNAGYSSNREDSWQRIAGWFLLISYLIGSPAFTIAEALTGVISRRFDYPPEFLYLVGVTQFCCALVLRKRSLAPWSCTILTVLSIGAVWSHLKINSPLTALPALGFTVVQVWYGYRVHVSNRRWTGT